MVIRTYVALFSPHTRCCLPARASTHLLRAAPATVVAYVHTYVRLAYADSKGAGLENRIDLLHERSRASPGRSFGDTKRQAAAKAEAEAIGGPKPRRAEAWAASRSLGAAEAISQSSGETVAVPGTTQWLAAKLPPWPFRGCRPSGARRNIS